MCAKIVIRNVSKSFGWKKVLRNISLDIEANSRVVIVGPNGAGKTTLLRIMAGLETPDEGRVEVRGKLIYVPETSFAPLTARVVDWLRLHDIDPNELLDLARSCGIDLAPYLTKPLAHLSKGMRRLLEVLTILLIDSDVVLLDEPFSGIAPRTAYQLANVLTRYSRDRERIVVFTSHIHEGVSLLLNPDKVYVLEDGVLRMVNPSNNVVIELFTIEGVKQIAVPLKDVQEYLSRLLEGLGKWVLEIRMYPEI